MIKKLVICAILALVLVPATVMAAGFGGQNNGSTPGQGQYLQDGQNCANQSCAAGSGSQIQCRNGGQQNGENCTCGSQDGQCTNGQKHTGSMGRLHDGACTGCKNGAVTTP
ncbi:hypothetical protein [Methanoregula sp.]|uniref:hypothetical protein n=1 Tax=Methanoregula sp. TaxID=2052170 RepID=UPI003568BFE1